MIATIEHDHQIGNHTAGLLFAAVDVEVGMADGLFHAVDTAVGVNHLHISRVGACQPRLWIGRGEQWRRRIKSDDDADFTVAVHFLACHAGDVRSKTVTDYQQTRQIQTVAL